MQPRVTAVNATSSLQRLAESNESYSIRVSAKESAKIYLFDSTHIAVMLSTKSLPSIVLSLGLHPGGAGGQGGKPQAYISRVLLFGRFLSNMPTGINAENMPNNLTERRFRGYWAQTDKSPNERGRFASEHRASKHPRRVRAEWPASPDLRN
jgi:hypothetical protein